MTARLANPEFEIIERVMQASFQVNFLMNMGRKVDPHSRIFVRWTAALADYEAMLLRVTGMRPQRDAETLVDLPAVEPGDNEGTGDCVPC